MTRSDLNFLRSYLNKKVESGLVKKDQADDICAMMEIKCLKSSDDSFAQSLYDFQHTDMNNYEGD